MIKIITDSASDYGIENAEKDNISIVPMHVCFDDIEFLDGVELGGKEFFEKLIESSVLPKTAQITPSEFEKEFKKYPNDQIICITLSKKLSGTYQSACIAANMFDNVTVVDSENVTIGEKILIKLALRLVDEGLSVQEIVKKLNEYKKNIRLVALLDTLEYLKKGGRISAITATIGGLLNIKPVVEIRNGEVKLIGKARGSKMGNNKLREKINEYGGIDYSRPYAVAYSGLSDSLLKKYVQDSKDICPEGMELEFTLIGSTIGTHVGPGAIAVAFYTKD